MVMILVSMFVPNVYWLFFIMLFFGWTVLVGIVRAEFLKARQLDYVRAAQVLGVTDHAIILGIFCQMRPVRVCLSYLLF